QPGKVVPGQTQSQQPKQAQRALQDGYPARGEALHELDGNQQERSSSHDGTKPPHGSAKAQHAARNKHHDQGADNTIARQHSLFAQIHGVTTPPQIEAFLSDRSIQSALSSRTTHLLPAPHEPACLSRFTRRFRYGPLRSHSSTSSAHPRSSC